MIVKYDEEFFSIKLRKDIGEKPYEVIPIDELLEVWEDHKRAEQTERCYTKEDVIRAINNVKNGYGMTKTAEEIVENLPQTEPREKCDRADADCENCWKQLHCRAEPIPKDVVVSCGNENVIMSEDTYEELIEQCTPKRGKWIYGEDEDSMYDGYTCNKCGFFMLWKYRPDTIDFADVYNFCPNCGADMRGVNHELDTM